MTLQIDRRHLEQDNVEDFSMDRTPPHCGQGGISHWSRSFTIDTAYFIDYHSYSDWLVYPPQFDLIHSHV